MHARAYSEFLRYARKVTRRADEAEDLLQAVLLAAVEAGRADMSIEGNRRWLSGALRKRALFDARTAVRRRQRETATLIPDGSLIEREYLPLQFVSELPPSLKTTALLALTGHSRLEIAWLLGLSDSALRQRLSGIKRRWRKVGGNSYSEIPCLKGSLSFGLIRKALLKPVQIDQAVLASHDHDGHLFVFCSQNHQSRATGKGIQHLKGISTCSAKVNLEAFATTSLTLTRVKPSTVTLSVLMFNAWAMMAAAMTG